MAILRGSVSRPANQIATDANSTTTMDHVSHLPSVFVAIKGIWLTLPSLAYHFTLADCGRAAVLFDDLVDRILDDPLRPGGLQLRDNGADDTLFDDRIDVGPFGIGKRRDGRFL